MKKIFLLLSAIFLAACGTQTSAANQPAADSPAPSESAPQAVSALTLKQLRNAQYPIQSWDNHPLIQLQDGKYQNGAPDPNNVEFAYVGMADVYAFGDLTGDGVDEAAVMMLENFGGTGNFAFLAVYANVNGQPVFLDAAFIDDRPLLNAARIENGEALVDAVIHGFEDGGCCPQMASVQRFTLTQNQLRRVHFVTNTPDGKPRTIEILSPVSGAEASGSAILTGTVSIAPFENNLAYFIYDEAGNELSAGPIPVNAPDFGAAGTFEAAVSLADAPTGGVIYIEIQDQSAADGSLLAMDSVKLLVK
ncbi:MAG: hypothetical protein Fur002_12780 [Anaerolineales bacterium]